MKLQINEEIYQPKYRDFDAAVKDVNITSNLSVIHYVGQAADYYSSKSKIFLDKKNPLAEASLRAANVLELKHTSNEKIRLHDHNYRLLKMKNPEIQIFPHYLGMFATNGVPGLFLKGLQTALKEIFNNKDIPEWTLIVPHRLSRIYNARGLMKGLEKAPEDTDVVCLMGSRYYDIAKAKEHAIILQTPKGQITDEAEYQIKVDYQKSIEMKWWIDIMLNDTVIPGWYIDEKWLSEPDSTVACIGDIFAIRTKKLKFFHDVDYEAVKPLLDRIELVINLGMNKLKENVPKLSFWMINLLNHPGSFFDYNSGGKVHVGQIPELFDDHLNEFQPGFNERVSYLKAEVILLHDDMYIYTGVNKEPSLPIIYETNVEQERMIYLHEPKNSCSKKVKLLAIIKTSYHRFDRRKMIRNMFEKMLNKDDYELYFLIGYIHNVVILNAKLYHEKQTAINDITADNGKPGYKSKRVKGEMSAIETDWRIIAETAETDDLIIGGFEDTYENLPEKTLLGYQFINDRCSESFDFVSFSDDDAFLDLGNITSLITTMKPSEPIIRCLKGNVITKENAPYSGKYALWNDLWPINYEVPDYCNGQCALLSRDAARKIYTEAKRTSRHSFRLEDIFYVGILRKKANITDLKGIIYQESADSKPHAFCQHLAEEAKPENFKLMLDKWEKGKLRIPPSN